MQKHLSLAYKKLEEIFKIIIKPLKIKVVTELDKSKIAVVGGYLEQDNYNKRLFFWIKFWKLRFYKMLSNRGD